MSAIGLFTKRLSAKSSAHHRAKRRGSRLHRRGGALRGALRVEALELRSLLSGVALDPTFGHGGLVTTDILGRSSDMATNVAITQPDGKIVVAGTAGQPFAGEHFLVERYNANGTLDTSFGNGGIVTTTLGFNWQAHAMALDGSGRIIVVGDADVGEQDVTLVRYNSDGSLDASFGSGGIVTTRFENSACTANGVNIDAAGRIEIVGEVYHNTQTSNYQLLLARYNSNGGLDTTFGNGVGATFTSLGTEPTVGNALAIDGTGNLVVAGSYGYSSDSKSLVARFTNTGALDPSFNGTGTALSSFGGTAQLNAVTIDANQQIVAAGAATIGQQPEIAVARYTSTGALDSAFGNGGEATTAFAFGDLANGLALDSAGNIVLAGQSQYSQFDAFRFRPNGTLDGSFGTGGKAVVDFGPALTVNQAHAVAITPAGKILLAGQASDPTAVDDLALAQLNPDGTPDTAFGTSQNGTVLSSLQLSTSNDARAMAIQSDGKIVTAGSSFASDGRDFSVTRYTSDGALDTSFGVGGVALTNITGISYPTFDNTANALAIDSQGRIIVAGTVDHVGGGTDIAVVRYDSHGKLDTTFGNGGIVVTSLITYGFNKANGVAVASNGDILVSGGTSPAQSSYLSNFALLRYTSTGQLDPTFGGAAYGGGPGWVQTDFNGEADLAYSMVLQSDGKIVLAGSAQQFATADDFALARYNPDGSLDTSFGIGGKVTTDFGSQPYPGPKSIDDAYGVTIDASGRIIAAGASAIAGRFFNFAVARYDSAGNLDPTFGVGGKVITVASYSNSFAGPVIATPDGKILVGGEADFPGQDRNFTIARYNNDGTLDTTFGPVSGVPSAGIVNTDFGGGTNGWDQIYGMALDQQGRLVAAGASFHPDTSFDIGIARYNLGGNTAPTVSARGPYTINEGDSLSLHAVASDADGDPLNYAWDINGDGVFTDATGPDPMLSWSQLEALSPPVNDGPATFEIRVRVDDGHGNIVTSAPVTLTVNNVPPTASLAAPPLAVPYQPLTFTLAATDPSAADQAAGFSYTIDWGDGTTQTIAASPGDGAGLSVQHAYAALGSDIVRVTATDKDGGVSQVVTQSVGVVAAALEPDQFNPGKTALFVGGTPGDDQITIKPVGHSGDVVVRLNDQRLGPFDPTGRIVVYGGPGNDYIDVSPRITLPAWLFGGDGNDVLIGGGGNDVLMGGAGDDVLVGGRGRNLLVGGTGSDLLISRGEDIVVTGDLHFADLDAALNDIMKEWTSSDALALREAYLGGAGGGLNGNTFLSESLGTVVQDSSPDIVIGNARDWLFDDPTLDLAFIARGSASSDGNDQQSLGD